MDNLLFLTLFPFIISLGLLITRKDNFRRPLVWVSALIIIATSALLLADYSGPILITRGGEEISQAMLAIEMLIALYILAISAKHRKYSAIILVLLQSAVILYYELNYASGMHLEENMFLDELSLVMALIIGVIGSLITVYALGYMKDFHHEHKEAKDHRSQFFFIMYVFLSAMFGLVFSNNLLWVYFFWEITTICSFILIAYTRTHEAWTNAFKALSMNLVGGLGFALAIFYLGSSGAGMIGISQLLRTDAGLIMLPVILIGFAGLTKAAQMPFSGWLVGAMIAPTPVSALLHSSTMVKAGVYMIVRLAPLLEGSLPGFLLALVGATSFLLASSIAITQSNAKKVLAYSTIANLGLVVACGGLGTYEAVWAAMLLIIFHAISKSLLFLSVGTVEHRIMSRDIEDMGGLIIRMPKIAVMMLIGMAGMFLAPFGMLISKWATLRAFVDASPLLVVIIAFGSAVTLFFWSKWMGKIIAVTYLHKKVEDKVNLDEWVSLYAITLLVIGVCFLFPEISSRIIEPFLLSTYGMAAHLEQGNITTMLLMLTILLIMPISLLYYLRKRKHLAPYMGGRTTSAEMRFEGSLGMTRDLALHNYYLESMFGENKVSRIGIWACICFIALMFFTAYQGVLIL